MKTQCRVISSTRRSERRSPSAIASNAVRARGASAAAMPGEFHARGAREGLHARVGLPRCRVPRRAAASLPRCEPRRGSSRAWSNRTSRWTPRARGGPQDRAAASSRRKKRKRNIQPLRAMAMQSVEHEVVLEDRGVREPRGDFSRGAPGQDDTAHGAVAGGHLDAEARDRPDARLDGAARDGVGRARGESRACAPSARRSPAVPTSSDRLMSAGPGTMRPPMKYAVGGERVDRERGARVHDELVARVPAMRRDERGPSIARPAARVRG